MSDLVLTELPSAKSRVSVRWSDVRGALALVVAGGWGGYFLFTSMPQLTLHVFPRTIALHAMAGGMALAYLAWIVASRKLPGGTPLDFGVLALVAAYGIATWASIAWRPSLEATLLLLMGVIAFYALSGLPWLTAQSLARAFMLACAALALYALWVVGNDYADYLSLVRRVEGLSSSNIFPPTVPRVHDVSDHPNVLAMVLTLALPMFTVYALRGRSAERAVAAAALAVGCMAIFLTLSRGGWLGAGTGIVLAALGVWITLRVDERERRGEPVSVGSLLPAGFSPTALAAVLGAAALIVAGTLAFLANSSSRPGWLFRGSLSPREDAWRAAWHMFLDHPLFGAGPSSFGLLYPEYAHGDFLVHTQHAHNGFLQVADDAGLLGIAMLVVLGAAVAFVLVRSWTRGTLEQRLLTVACAAGLFGFCVHNQLDAGNVWKAPVIALAFVGAIGARNYREATDGSPPVWQLSDERVRRYGRVAVQCGVVALLVVPLGAWYRIDRAHYDYWRGVETANEFEPDPVSRLQDAVDADSSMMVYRLQLGQAEATQYVVSQEKDAALIQRAIVNLQQAVRLDKRSDLAHANLARAYQLAGDDRAADEAAKTRVIARYHVAPVLVAAEVYEDLGRDDDAIDTYGQVISMDASLADSAYWEQTAFRREHFADILKHSSLGINECTAGAHQVIAHRSDPTTSLDGLSEAAEGCQFIVFGQPNDLAQRVNYALILAQLGDRDGALAHLQYAVKRQPDYAPARTELGRWYQAAGNLDEARHQWVVGSELDDPESVMLLGDTYDPADLPAGLADKLESLLKTSGSSIQNDLYSVLYYRMRYGRLSPVLAMIPGDWQTAVPRVFTQMQAALQRWRGSDSATR